MYLPSIMDIRSISAGASNNSATPMSVAQISVDPTLWRAIGTTVAVKFRATAYNANGLAASRVQLYSITDAEQIALLSFASATPGMQETALTLGASSGNMDLSAKIYEVRIWCISPDGIDDSIELGSAELVITNSA